MPTRPLQITPYVSADAVLLRDPASPAQRRNSLEAQAASPEKWSAPVPAPRYRKARVTIAPVQAQTQTVSLITSADGAFDFKGLPAGKYSLSAARRGFIESSYNQHERYSTAIVAGG